MRMGTEQKATIIQGVIGLVAMIAIIRLSSVKTWPESARWPILAGLILLYLAAGGVMWLRQRRQEMSSPTRLTLVRALVFMFMGLFLLTLPQQEGYGLAQAAGQCYLFISCYIVLKNVYRLPDGELQHGQQLVEEQIKCIAYYDELTGLPNLRQMRENLSGSLGMSHTSTGVGVIHIGRFKAINDSLGYEAGDKLLTELGSRLTALCRGQEQVYRMNEAEFAVLLPDMPDIDALEARAKQLISIDPAVLIDGTEYHITLSMGLSVYPNDGDSVDQMIQNADMAVQQAKAQGHDFIRYNISMKQRTQLRVELENDMRKALEREEFFLEFQPQVSLDTGRMVGIEALVRWNHPKRGILSPSEFIPLAEESGLIVPLGEWVLKTACQYSKRWQVEGYDPICVSVNLSMRQFRQCNLADRVGAIIREVGLEPRYLELEVTESMTYDIDTALEQLNALKKLGIHISIDDFGTGYSSLYYLKSLPIDRLKIDRAFVREVMYDGNDAAIVSTITTMAHHLNLKVTAEGVENEAQLEFLKLQKCHEAQGYLFSKPVSAEVLKQEFLSRTVG